MVSDRGGKKKQEMNKTPRRVDRGQHRVSSDWSRGKDCLKSGRVLKEEGSGNPLSFFDP